MDILLTECCLVPYLFEGWNWHQEMIYLLKCQFCSTKFYKIIPIPRRNSLSIIGQSRDIAYERDTEYKILFSLVLEIIKEISHRVNSNSSIFASAQIIPCYWHHTAATTSLTAHYFCSYKLYKKALSVADAGEGPSLRVTCRQKWNECGQQEFFFRLPPSPTPRPYLQVSLHEVPFPEFPSHSHRILDSSILLGWSFTNHHIISSWSISMVKWIWSKVSPKHF